MHVWGWATVWETILLLRELWGTNLGCLVCVESTVTQNLRAVLCGFIHGVLSVCLSDIGNLDQRCWPWHDKWEVGKSVQLWDTVTEGGGIEGLGVPGHLFTQPLSWYSVHSVLYCTVHFSQSSQSNVLEHEQYYTYSPALASHHAEPDSHLFALLTPDLAQPAPRPMAQ